MADLSMASWNYSRESQASFSIQVCHIGFLNQLDLQRQENFSEYFSIFFVITINRPDKNLIEIGFPIFSFFLPYLLLLFLLLLFFFFNQIFFFYPDYSDFPVIFSHLP